MSYNVPIDLDKIKYAGETDAEKELNKQLLETILELNSYQDSYDVMRTVEELKERLENRKILIHEEYIPQEEVLQLQGEIKALEWVLNGSRTTEEKSADLPKASKEEVTKIIKNFNEQYKQLSLEDLGVMIDEKSN